VRDALKELSGRNIAVVGISPDKPETQKKFDDKHNLGFPLLSDPDHKTAEAYGVWGEKKMYGKTFMGIIRSSFLIDEKGIILNAWYKISPKNTVPELMKVLD
jgi:peroxiredoxin Q/BCP